MAAFLSVVSMNSVDWLGYLELRINQNRLMTTHPIAPNPQIILVTIDKTTPIKLGINRRPLPLPRDQHAKLIGFLQEAGARVLLFDLTFSVKTGREDQDFYDAITRNDVLPVVLAAQVDKQERASGTPTGWKSWFEPPVLFEGRRKPPNVVVGSPVSFDPDGRLDGAVLLSSNSLTGQKIPHIALAAALKALQVDPTRARLNARGNLVTADAFAWPVGEDGELHVRWTRHPGMFLKVEYADALVALQQKRSGNLFQDKIVLVGDSSGEDVHLTPLGRIDGVEFVAHVLNTLLLPDTSNLTRWNILKNGAWCWLLALCAAFSVPGFRPVSLLTGLLGTALVALLLPHLMLVSADVWIDTVGPCLSIVLSAGLTTLKEGVQSGTLARRFTPAFVRDRRPEKVTEEATILFVDLCGSTAMAQSIGAVAAQEVQSELLRRLSIVIMKHGGEVERTLGDGLMAVFRQRPKSEHHALRGVGTTGALQEAVDGFDAELRKARNLKVQITIGIESGIISGTVVKGGGNEEWSSFGPTVNLAARLQSACGDVGMNVLIGPVAYSLVQHKIPLSFLQILELKGVTGATPVYRLEQGLSQTVAEDCVQ